MKIYDFIDLNDIEIYIEIRKINEEKVIIQLKIG